MHKCLAGWPFASNFSSSEYVEQDLACKPCHIMRNLAIAPLSDGRRESQNILSPGETNAS